MKRIIILLLAICYQVAVFSQQELQDGIYLVDESVKDYTHLQEGRAAIEFNSLFVEEEPEKYEPVVIQTKEYVAFELKGMPVIQNEKQWENALLVRLTDNASEKLEQLTASNLSKHMAVVLDGLVIAIYKIVQPVTGDCVKLAHCNGLGCQLMYKRLKAAVSPGYN
jgi:preprotein translocase subunit SecD